MSEYALINNRLGKNSFSGALFFAVFAVVNLLLILLTRRTVNNGGHGALKPLRTAGTARRAPTMDHCYD
ncbi:MAG: hypothetical protein ACOYNV_14900 [Propionivibrio sp.]